MVQTRLEILEEELNQVKLIIIHQFIERDIALITQDSTLVSEIHDEINAYMRRRDAIEQLIKAEKDKLDGWDSESFEATIHIVPHLFG